MIIGTGLWYQIKKLSIIEVMDHFKRDLYIFKDKIKNEIEPKYFTLQPKKNPDSFRYYLTPKIDDLFTQDDFQYFVKRMIIDTRHKRFRFDAMNRFYDYMLEQVEVELTARNISFEKFTTDNLVQDFSGPRWSFKDSDEFLSPL